MTTTRTFSATIDWGSADGSPALDELPDDLKRVCQQQADNEEAYAVVRKYITANFVNDGVDELFDVTDDVFASQIFVYGLWFEKGKALPKVKADAAFELKVKPAFDDVNLDEWEEETGQYLTDCVNFFWKLPDESFDGVMTNHEGAGFGPSEAAESD